MFKVNEDYLKLPGSYLFSTIGKKVAAYSAANPDKSIIRLGIGDVTQPLAPAIIKLSDETRNEMRERSQGVYKEIEQSIDKEIYDRYMN